MERLNHIIIMLLMLVAGIGGIPAFGAGRLYKEVPTIEGLESNGFTTYSMTRTDDGFMWFATDHGLLRFDGEHAVRIGILDDDQSMLTISTVAPTDDGGLIATTSKGVFKVIKGKQGYESKNILDGQVPNATESLRIPGKFILIGAADGLRAVMPDGSVRRIHIGKDILDSGNKVLDMAESPSGVFVLTEGGIFRVQVSDLSVSPVCVDERLKKLGVSAIAPADGRVYLGTSGNGIWRVDLDSGELREAFPFTEGNVVTAIRSADQGKTLYVATDGGGVAKIDASTERVLERAYHDATDPASPRSSQVYSLYVDEGDNIWIGYYQNGVDYTPAWTGPFNLIDNPAAFNTRGVPVRALAIADGNIVIGTREGIVTFEKDSTSAWTLRSPRLRSEMVISLLSHKGKVYVGTYGGGVQILDPITRQLSEMPGAETNPVFRSGHIFALTTDRLGNLWMGTNDGLYRTSPDGTRKHFTSANSSLPDGNVYGIFFDSEGKGWICTDSGICVYDPRQDKLRKDLFPSGFPHSTRFRSVYEGKGKRLCFVPERGMAFSTRLDLSDLAKLDHPLLEGVDAKGVVEDSGGNLWLTTNRGIFRIDSHGHVVRFGLASGLPSSVFLQGQPVADGLGHIWLGNSAGLMCLTEAEVEQSLRQQRAPIPTMVKVSGEVEDLIRMKDDEMSAYEIVLRKPSTSIEIGFSPLTYAVEEPDSYMYSLDGGDWHRFAKRLSLGLYDLAPGSHKLLVKSANDSDEEADVTVVNIRVPYPLWWYVVGVLAIALFGSGVGIWALIAHKRRVAREKRAVEAASAVRAHEEQSAETDAPRKKYAANNMTRTEAREISRKIEEIMEAQKPYLESDLKVGDLAELAGISSHKLSQFFSQHKKQSFYDYINSFRVEEFKRVATRNRNLTLSAMAEKAGFSSRASFFRYFKAAEGVSPGEWLKNLEKQSGE